MSPYNLIVTNVPGPPVTLYFLGAPMVGGYPSVPLFENQGLAVALFSYGGKLFWGFSADWDLMPDLGDFVASVQRSFAELRHAAGVQPTKIAPLRKTRPRLESRVSGLGS
jgi:hypothetical protein